MSQKPQNHISREVWDLLIQISDPEKSMPDVADFSDRCIFTILDLARNHGVIEIVGQKLCVWLSERGFFNEVQALAEERQQLVAKTMLLDYHAHELIDRFRREEIHAEIVKGPVFADLLYKNRGQRTYSDIDFLVKSEDIVGANQVAKEYGLRADESQWHVSEQKLEYKWFLTTATLNILIEIQGNLVHRPSLRKHAGFGYQEYLVANHLGTSPFIKLLITAVVHTAFSDKFEILKVLIDVLQACRKLSPSDYESLKLVVRSLSFELEIGVTVYLVAKLFNDENAHRIAALFEKVGAVQVGRMLITPNVIYASQYGLWPARAVLAKVLFRSIQKFPRQRFAV